MGITRLPFHADHIGSLIRPSTLAEAQEQADAGKISVEELRQAQAASIADLRNEVSEELRVSSSGLMHPAFQPNPMRLPLENPGI